MFRFALPWAFVALPACLAAAWWMARRRSRSGSRLALPRVEMLASLGRSPWHRVDRMLPWLRGLALALLVAALARPQSGARQETVSTEGVDIIVALDISGSMRCEDFRPMNRLAVAKRTVTEFAEGRPSDRLGLVVFSAVATTRCPLTLDGDMFRRFVEETDFTPQDEDGTAIGLGLATAVNRLRNTPSKSKVVVLVTDGRNNRGQIGPEAAADVARALGVKVYTIGVGTKGEAPYPVGEGPLGTRYVLVREDLDEPLLRKVATTTGGQYFRATDPETLRQVFAKINSLEKTRIDSRVRILYAEMFPWFLLPAGVLLLLEGLLSWTRLRRIP